LAACSNSCNCVFTYLHDSKERKLRTRGAGHTVKRQYKPTANGTLAIAAPAVQLGAHASADQSPPWRPCVLVHPFPPNLQYIGATPAHAHSLGRVRYAGLHGASNAAGHDGLARVFFLTARAAHCKRSCMYSAGGRVIVVWQCRYRPRRDAVQALRSTNASSLLGACATITLLRDVSTGAPGAASSRWMRYGLNKLDIASMGVHSLVVVVVRVPP
jgi:hypothetical protein